MQMLAIRYKELFKSDLIKDLSLFSGSPELNYAVSIISERARPELMPMRNADRATVEQDLEQIKTTLKMAFPFYASILQIFLHRSDFHITQIAAQYKEKEKKDLDKVIAKNPLISKPTKKIILQALRTVTDMAYRDAMLLRDTMKTSNQENSLIFGIRVVRAHYFTEHWKHVKTEYERITRKLFIQGMIKWKGEAEFHDLMVALAHVDTN